MLYLRRDTQAVGQKHTLTWAVWCVLVTENETVPLSGGGLQKARSIRLPSYTPTSLCGTNVIYRLSQQTHSRDHATLVVWVCAHERVCGVCVFVWVRMCHLCVSYSKALTQNEVSPSSRFDESMVIACVCVCQCVRTCVCVWVPVCWHTQKGLCGGDTGKQNWWWKYDISRCIWSQPVLEKYT